VKVAFLQEMKAVETIGGPTIGLLVRYSCLGDVVDRWRMDYNHYRPHSTLAYMAPAAFAVKCLE
jgi:hypothetical protein